MRPTELPFKCERLQFPVRLSFAMTKNLRNTHWKLLDWIWQILFRHMASFMLVSSFLYQSEKKMFSILNHYTEIKISLEQMFRF